MKMNVTIWNGMHAVSYRALAKRESLLMLMEQDKVIEIRKAE
ncbi:hypothetical protein [Bacillus atrophaeus]|nr:hypothetical protein [Bacillus atrophaeus]